MHSDAKEMNSMPETQEKPSIVGRILEASLFAMYGALWRVARPLLRRHKRLRDEFAMRLVPEGWSGPADIWVQAASGGEAYLAWQWLKALPFFAPNKSDAEGERDEKQLGTPPRILLTSCTRQGLDVLHEAVAWAQDHCEKQGLPPIFITVQVFPLDQPRLMRRALNMVNPRTVVMLETELWPSLMRACRQASVPMMVLNGRMSPRSFAAYFAMRSFWKNFTPRRIAAISHDDAMRFAMLFGCHVDVVPNMKFDKVGEEFGQDWGKGNPLKRVAPSPRPPSLPKLFYCDANDVGKDNSRRMEERKEDNSLSEKHKQIAAMLPQDTKIILLGSVREEEEILLVSAVCQLGQTLDKAKTPYTVIVAPRHMHRVTSWQERLHRVGLQCVLRSDLGPSSHEQNPIIIWDTFGELGALYGLAHAVFVGGSLMPLGGQNFLEPLGKGLVPCVGPYLENFAWVEPQSLKDAGLLTIVRTDVELAQSLAKAIQEGSTSRDAVQASFRDWLQPRLGGASVGAHMVLDIGRDGGKK